MIAKISFAEGVPLPLELDALYLALGELMFSNSKSAEYLPPGEYDVTPKIWTAHTHNHQLVVFDNGEGLYRIFPRDTGAGFVKSSPTGDTPFRHGGRHIPINAESPTAVIVGGHPTKREPQIYGIITYLLD